MQSGLLSCGNLAVFIFHKNNQCLVGSVLRGVPGVIMPQEADRPWEQAILPLNRRGLFPCPLPPQNWNWRELHHSGVCKPASQTSTWILQEADSQFGNQKIKAWPSANESLGSPLYICSLPYSAIDRKRPLKTANETQKTTWLSNR